MCSGVLSHVVRKLIGYRLFQVLLLLFTVLASGCAVSELPSTDVADFSDYYPLKIGTERIYAVNDVRFTFVDGTRESNYELKELVADTFRLNDGNLAWRLERYTRASSSDEWQVDSVFSIWKSGNQLIRSESSIPYLKLVFPIVNGATWNGNAFNNNDPDNFSLYRASVLRDTTIAGERVRTIKVVQKADSNCRTNEQAYEVYAAKIGPIKRRIRRLVYAETNPPCSGVDSVEVGRDYTEVLKSYTP